MKISVKSCILIVFATGMGSLAFAQPPVIPKAANYIACSGATVTLEVEPQVGVSYYWYTLSSGGSLLASASNSYSVLNVSPPYTVWVEPRVGGTTYTRRAITIQPSQSCGGTATVSCAVNGTLLFKEDFGGNSPSSPTIKPTGISQVSSSYTYVTTSAGIYNSPTYSINKQSLSHPAWHTVDDHTSPADITIGYMLQVNADAIKGQFYEYTINGLCSGTKLYFSAWLISLLTTDIYADKTNQIFTLEDYPGHIIVQYNTGNVRDADPTWKQYGFEFTVPSGINSLTLRIVNNGTGAAGNDFCLDDIEIHFCSPQVTLTTPSALDTAVCQGLPITFSASYTDDGTFGGSLTYRWERSLTGDPTNHSAWTAITADLSGTSPLNSSHSISAMSAADTGYYRLVVANSSTIDSSNCRATSEPVRLQMLPLPVLALPANDTVCADNNTASVNFTGTNVDANSCTWLNSNPAIGLAASGTGNIPSFTATNTTNAAITGYITVTPVSSAGCTGTPKTFSITVTSTVVPTVVIQATPQ